ncbi:M13 family metallopeptidase [Pendulispora brunnea]|uniref:M13 family metallopeptidase n=1 Tax=Pendulispora brunnea TaxID=2905690 RepID=A0ABZ2KCE9_9BACT
MRLSPLPLLTFSASVSGVALAVACGGGEAETPPPVQPVGVTPAPIDAGAATSELVSIDPKAIDDSVKPCDDFYQFACGRWMKETKIPDDQARWERSFDVIFENNEKLLREILERDGQSPPADEAYSKPLGDYYAACMDEKGIETAGDKPLTLQLAKAGQVKDANTFAQVIAELHGTGQRALFAFTSEQDFADATQVIGTVQQGGLGMPDRDYYLKDDPKSKGIRDKYEAHIAEMLRLSGETPEAAKAGAKTVLRLESELAKASMTKVDLRDPHKVYHRLELAGLKKLAPDFAWDTYLKAVGFPNVTAINVAQPEFFKAVGRVSKGLRAGGKTLADWRTYLKWHILHDNAAMLPARFVDEDFKFRSALTGAPKLLPRWKRCVRAVDGAMGEALAQPFVKTRLGAKGKTEALELIGGIETAMKGSLEGLAWMDDPTRKKALEKLMAINNKIAYPDVWRNYDGLEVKRDSYFDNALRARAFEVKRQLSKIGKPVDKKEWQMTPPEVNAYYDPSLNEMVFPAGILAYPFFASNAVPALNYGAIGMVMGHELTHGFDDEGREFDASGNLKEWWSPNVGKEFDRRAACVVSQFDGYVAVDDLHVNGKLTLGENIADLGGIKLAYTAFQNMKKGKEVPKGTHPYTVEQEFFLSYAQSWCGNIRPEMLRLQVTTNPHAPSKFRVNGPLSNFTEFARAFSCQEGSSMVRTGDKRCEIW